MVTWQCAVNTAGNVGFSRLASWSTFSATIRSIARSTSSGDSGLRDLREQRAPPEVRHRGDLQDLALARLDLVHAGLLGDGDAGHLERGIDAERRDVGDHAWQVVVPGQQEDANAALREPPDALGEQLLDGRARVRVLERVAGEQHDVHLVRQREVDELVEPRGEVEDPLIDAGGGIRLPVRVGAEMVVGEVQDPDHASGDDPPPLPAHGSVPESAPATCRRIPWKNV